MKELIITFVFLICYSCLQAQEFQPNYDETKVPEYVLPDVLKTTTGKLVRNKKEWERYRRGEILTLFENNIYGEMPKSYDSIRYSIVNENKMSMEGKAHLKEVLIEVFNQSKVGENKPRSVCSEQCYKASSRFCFDQQSKQRQYGSGTDHKK